MIDSVFTEHRLMWYYRGVSLCPSSLLKLGEENCATIAAKTVQFNFSQRFEQFQRNIDVSSLIRCEKLTRITSEVVNGWITREREECPFLNTVAITSCVTILLRLRRYMHVCVFLAIYWRRVYEESVTVECNCLFYRIRSRKLAVSNAIIFQDIW